jgi:Zinc-finger associated domain (zf-AD)/Zinc finger, C2H2 type
LQEYFENPENMEAQCKICDKLIRVTKFSKVHFLKIHLWKTHRIKVESIQPPASDKCRLCLSESSSIFYDVSDICEDMPISEIIMNVCPVIVKESDALPKHVCVECLNNVMTASKLRNQSIQSDELLRDSEQNDQQEHCEKCRLCLSENSVFFDVSEIREGFQISQIIMNVCPVTVEASDMLPKQVCVECLNCVMIAYKLRDQSFQSDRLLKGQKIQSYGLLMNQSTKNDQLLTDFEENDANEEFLIPLIKQEMIEHDGSVITFENYLIDDTHEGQSNGEKNFEPKKTCHLCSEKFIDDKVLDKHIERHEQNKLYCNICTADFYFVHQLIEHRKEKHKISSIFECDHCGDVFAQKNPLIWHIRSFHLKTENLMRKYECGVCNRKFKKGSHLKRHMGTHTHIVSNIFSVLELKEIFKNNFF